MKTKISQIALLFLFFFSLQTLYSQEESRYELTLNTDYNGIRNRLKLVNISYSLGNYAIEADPAIPQKIEPVYINATATEIANKEFYKIFENNKNKINGFIEIKDNYGKNPLRKIEFKNSSLVLSESISNYSSGNSVSIAIYGYSVIVDGVGIYSK
ncbi:hypothetical protein [Flavobacterium sp.]|uniref:hypothetical protein n=1 Tax=Flavobacterium sp. TaxID=239 RepID=UPI00286DA7EE|nr:hypothetical protein [Flavobacterium sp.]